MFYLHAESGISIEIKNEVIHKFIEFCINTIPYETGGILIGNYTEDKMKANITQIVGAPSDSIREKYHFKRGILGLQSILNKLWKDKEYYLGEWHFHPYSSSYPSRTDDDQMVELSENLRLNCPEPILIIIGGDPKAVYDINVFLYKKKDRLKLSKVESTL